jgi:hypothetical protein
VLRENIARAVAEGIAQGRKGGFELAVKRLRDETVSVGSAEVNDVQGAAVCLRWGDVRVHLLIFPWE